MTIDWSTINLTELSKLSSWEVPAHLHISDSLGMGCFLDPPGYPTYFLRAVYTGRGDSPSRGPAQVISHPEAGVRVSGVSEWAPGDTWDTHLAQHKALMRRLYLPLPFDHPRAVGWISALFNHFHHCYFDDEGKVAEKTDGRTIIYPVPSYKLRHFHDDHRFSDEWRAKEKASIEQANADLCARYAEVCTPENHAAVRLICEVYPGYTPDLSMIETPPPRTGYWWETEPTQPAPEQCKPRSCGPHPVNRTWCQWCGWDGKPDKEEEK